MCGFDSDFFPEKKVISKEANLSQVYTNRSVRATTVTLLAHAGVDTREIMKISQH